MTNLSANAYDRLLYNNRPYPQTHPDHMAVIARLHGLNPPPVERARVLDLGASEGGNILPMAVALPEAQFTGLDLAAVPVDRGTQVIRDLALSNVRLVQMDLLDVDAAFGQFDYIIAHGLYAWTPPAVRDKVLAIASANLSPHGVAFISYNVYPGGHLRRLLRDMMLYRAGDADDPRLRLERARQMMRLLAAGRPQADQLETTMARFAQDTLEYTDSALYHDYLADVYEPVYFRDFVAHASRHGLAYLADARVLDTWNLRLHPTTADEVERIASQDRIAREQYFDFLRLRAFRQSLVCHAEACTAEAGFTESWSATRIVGMYAASSARQNGEGQFTNAAGVEMTTAHPGAIAILRKLISLWPGRHPISAADAEVTLELFRKGMVEVHTGPSAAVRAGERPLAHPLARYQARRGDTQISTLDLRSLAVADHAGRQFLQLLDGTRDRAALAQAMGCGLPEVDAKLEMLSRYAVLLA